MMVSLISAPNQFRLPRLANSSCVFVVCPATRQVLVGIRQNQTVQSFGVVHSIGVVRRCRISGNEDYSALEQEVLEFMLQPEDPDKFPTRKQLIDAGRRDLAGAILRKGGWMTRGWDLVSDDELENPELDTMLSKWDSIGQDKEKCEFEVVRVENSEVSSAELKIKEIRLGEAKELEGSYAEIGIGNGSYAPCDSSNPTASSSGRSGETAEDGGFGIEGILNRLEKQRNVSLGFHVEKKGNTLSSNDNGVHTGVFDTADSGHPHKDEAMFSLENDMVSIQDNMLSNTRRVNNRNNKPNYNVVRSSLEPDTWSLQSAGLSDSDFQAAEIDFGNKEESLEIMEDLKSIGKYNGDKMRSRLQNLACLLDGETQNCVHTTRSGN